MHNMTDDQRRAHIAALIREREYVLAEHADDVERLNTIDEQLRIYGHNARTPQTRAERRPRPAAQETR